MSPLSLLAVRTVGSLLLQTIWTQIRVTDCSLRKQSDLSPYAAQVHKQMREQMTMKGVNCSLLQIIGDTLIHCTLMPLLHLPSDEFMMPVRCPNHPFPTATTGRPCDHRRDSMAL